MDCGRTPITTAWLRVCVCLYVYCKYLEERERPVQEEGQVRRLAQPFGEELQQPVGMSWGTCTCMDARIDRSTVGTKAKVMYDVPTTITHRGARVAGSVRARSVSPCGVAGAASSALSMMGSSFSCRRRVWLRVAWCGQLVSYQRAESGGGEEDMGDETRPPTRNASYIPAPP